MTEIPLWGLTCAPASRLAEAVNTFEQAGIDPLHRVLVTTQPNPVAEEDFEGNVILFDGTEINISKWWTLGLDFISAQESSKIYPAGFGYGPKWDVLVIESDAVMSEEDVHTVRTAMRAYDCVMAGADWKDLLHGEPKIRRDNTAWNIHGRMPGICCIIAGERGIRHDPNFRWWLADDDFEWQHRVGGGTILVPNTTVLHTGTQPGLTGDRLTAWEEDQPRFINKWRGLPANGGI